MKRAPVSTVSLKGDSTGTEDGVVPSHTPRKPVTAVDRRLVLLAAQSPPLAR